MKFRKCDHLWNTTDLYPPKMEFKEIPLLNVKRKKLVNALKKEDSLNIYRNKLFLEANVLFSFNTRLKNKYRSDKGFKTAFKVTKAIESLKTLDIAAGISLVRLVLKGNIVPCKNVLLWLLVRLQSYSKLLDRIVYCSKRSGLYLHCRLRTGHNWLEVIIAIALLSRIWCVSNYLLEAVCKNYDDIREVIDALPDDREPWLLSASVLPTNLKTWIKNGEDDYPETSEINAESSIRMESNVSENGSFLNKSEHFTANSIKKFVKTEEKNRLKDLHKCATKNMDKLQWNMFKNWLLSYADHMNNALSQNNAVLYKKFEKEFGIWIP